MAAEGGLRRQGVLTRLQHDEGSLNTPQRIPLPSHHHASQGRFDLFAIREANVHSVQCIHYIKEFLSKLRDLNAQL